MTIAIMPNLKLIIMILFSVTIGSAYENEYTNEYAVHVRGGPEVADNLAVMYGYRNIGQIGSLKDHYLFEHSDVPRIAKRPATGPHTRLNDEENVQWMEQQMVIKREKRDMMNNFTDPLWSDEWYINRDGVTMKVQEAWDAGYTGKDVVVTIADDGLEIDHPDLIGNYDQEASIDLNDRDSNPYPRSTPDDYNNHGTRCAGAVAMMANNSICGVGIAYNARIGGIRILDGKVTDSVEASALSYQPQHVDIYSSSWGPTDDGETLEGPGRLVTQALYDGATNGRGGKGSIYVLAAGNGGVVDDCNCDGYQANIYTVSITSATEKGTKPFYTESCASALATTYSSGDAGERQICSTDEHQKCTKHHTG
uniref:Furin-like n=1 Tax=Saccoglossus kowalevskii TaxID=10224 RepID=A0ABM0GMC3_SACKO